MNIPVSLCVSAILSVTLLSACESTSNNSDYRGDRCEALLRQADSLKGKPLQRSAAMDRWRHECALK